MLTVCFSVYSINQQQQQKGCQNTQVCIRALTHFLYFRYINYWVWGQLADQDVRLTYDTTVSFVAAVTHALR